jgi:hypothetical protein
MPLSNIVIVVLRLFAIQMFVQSLSLTFSVAATVAVAGTWPRGYFSYLPAVALFVFIFGVAARARHFPARHAQV